MLMSLHTLIYYDIYSPLGLLNFPVEMETGSFLFNVFAKEKSWPWDIFASIRLSRSKEESYCRFTDVGAAETWPMCHIVNQWSKDNGTSDSYSQILTMLIFKLAEQCLDEQV